MAVNSSLLLRQFDGLWRLWADWLDLTLAVGIRSTSSSFRIIPVAWGICWLSCDSSLIREPATMMKAAWYSEVCIQCHPCLIIGYLLFYFGLSGSIYPIILILSSAGKAVWTWLLVSVNLGSHTFLSFASPHHHAVKTCLIARWLRIARVAGTDMS